MYEQSFTVGITAIKLTAKAVKGTIRRSLETTIELEFTEDIARALDQESTLESLNECSLEQAKISMSAFAASARYYAGKDQRSIVVRGRTATANMPKGDEEPATIKIPLVSQFNEEDLVYLARNLANQVTVRFTKRQLELVNDEPEAEAADAD